MRLCCLRKIGSLQKKFQRKSFLEKFSIVDSNTDFQQQQQKKNLYKSKLKLMDCKEVSLFRHSRRLFKP